MDVCWQLLPVFGAAENDISRKGIFADNICGITDQVDDIFGTLFSIIQKRIKIDPPWNPAACHHFKRYLSTAQGNLFNLFRLNKNFKVNSIGQKPDIRPDSPKPSDIF